MMALLLQADVADSTISGDDIQIEASNLRQVLRTASVIARPATTPGLHVTPADLLTDTRRDRASTGSIGSRAGPGANAPPSSPSIPALRQSTGGSGNASMTGDRSSWPLQSFRRLARFGSSSGDGRLEHLLKVRSRGRVAPSPRASHLGSEEEDSNFFMQVGQVRAILPQGVITP